MRLIQPSLRDLSDHGRWFPTLKRWAIAVCPSGTKTCPGLARILWDQILVALAGNGGGRARGDEAGFQSDWGILTAQHDKRGGGNEGRI